MADKKAAPLLAFIDKILMPYRCPSCDAINHVFVSWDELADIIDSGLMETVCPHCHGSVDLSGIEVVE